jgi:hypothetical protein
MVVLIFVTESDNQFEHKLSLKCMSYMREAGSVLLCTLLLQQSGLLNINQAGSPHWSKEVVRTSNARAETCWKWNCGIFTMK